MPEVLMTASTPVLESLAVTFKQTTPEAFEPENALPVRVTCAQPLQVTEVPALGFMVTSAIFEAWPMAHSLATPRSSRECGGPAFLDSSDR
jgi:hypothetical protein